MSKINKIAISIAILLAITNVVVLYCYYNWGRVENAIPYENKIDSLKLVNDSLSTINIDLTSKIDSLKGEVGVSDSIIIEIDHWYEKGLDSITNQSIADDAQFFSNYLSKIDSGFVNSNNSDSIKENKFNLSRTSETQIGDSTVRKKNRFTTRSKYDTTAITSSKGSANK